MFDNLIIDEFKPFDFVSHSDNGVIRYHIMLNNLKSIFETGNYSINYRWSLDTRARDKAKADLLDFISQHLDDLDAIPKTDLEPAFGLASAYDYDITLCIAGRADDVQPLKNDFLKLVQLLSRSEIYDVVYDIGGYHDDFWFSLYLNYKQQLRRIA